MKILRVVAPIILQVTDLVAILFLAQAWQLIVFERLSIQGSIAVLDVILAIYTFSLILIQPTLIVLDLAIQRWYRDFGIAAISASQNSLRQELIPIVLNSLLMCLLDFGVFGFAFFLSGIGVAVLWWSNRMANGKIATTFSHRVCSLTWTKHLVWLLICTLWTLPLLNSITALWVREKMSILEVIVLWNLNLLTLLPLCRLTLRKRIAQDF